MHSRSVSRYSFVVAAFLALASLACFAVPMYVIWPFRRQGPTELQLALFVKRIGPWLSIACAVLCLAIVAYVWKSLRSRISRTGGILLVLLAIGGAWLTRVNVYEHMFHPIGASQFESARDAKLDPGDMVIAIRVNDQRRAYPIREMGYHHVVNDTVGGEPVVATY